MKKIAFCFLIYDEINHEDIWNIFFNNIDKNKYNIYIHYKYNKPLKYFEQYKLKNCIDTNYDDITIPQAYNLLFKEAFEKDEENYKFCIISNSCIPLKSFNHIYNKLVADDKAYFNICDSSQCYPNCNPLLNFYDKKYISKSHNWFILNRTIVQKICIECNDELTKCYKDIYAPAEYFFYTKVKMLDLENHLITTNNVSCEATTFTNWAGNDYINPCQFGLANYSFISKYELEYLVNSPCLFGRKFTKNCSCIYTYDFYLKMLNTVL